MAKIETRKSFEKINDVACRIPFSLAIIGYQLDVNIMMLNNLDVELERFKNEKTP